MKDFVNMIFAALCSGLVALFFVLSPPSDTLSDESMGYGGMDEVVNFLLASDLHYQPEVSSIAASLIPQIAYIDEILEAFTAEVLDQDPQALILCGDLTNNGRYEEHVSLVSKLEPLRQKGITVFVLPGNHDITPDTAETFAELYKDFGYGQALYRDKHSLSYVAAASDSFWWLLLDTSLSGESAYTKDGIVCNETLIWIEQVLMEAQAANVTVLSAGHHNILNPNAEIYSYDQVEGSKTLVELFKAYDVPLYASGHRHHHSIMKEASGAGAVVEFSEPMLADYPNIYGQISINTATRDVAYQTKTVDMASWAEQHQITDSNLRHFRDFSKRCNQQLCDLLASGIVKELQVSAEENQPISEFLSVSYMAFYDGTMYEKREQLLLSEGYQLWQKYKSLSGYEHLFDYMLQYLTESQHTYRFTY